MNDVLAILAIIGLIVIAIGAILEPSEYISHLESIIRANPVTRHHLQKRKKGRFTK